MTPTPKPNVPLPLSQAEFQGLLHEKLRAAIWLTLATILQEEVTAFIGAPRYGRLAGRRDQRNGYYTRDLVTTVGKLDDLRVPRTHGGFRSQVFERYQRRQAELDTAISEMFVFGASTTRVGEVVETLTGTPPGASTVSRVFHTLEGEFTTWKTRKLAAHYVYVFADGTYFTVIYEGAGQKMPILAVIGITESGEREVLAFTVGERENQAAWVDLLEQLKARGVQTVGLWITDGNQATLNAVQLKFAVTPRQRCIKHKMENVLGYVPEKQREQVEPELKALFYQDSRAQAGCPHSGPVYEGGGQGRRPGPGDIAVATLAGQPASVAISPARSGRTRRSPCGKKLFIASGSRGEYNTQPQKRGENRALHPRPHAARQPASVVHRPTRS